VKMNLPILGWDVGGANIKAVRIRGEEPPSESDVVQHPFPLWREPEGLASMLGEVADRLGGTGAVRDMAITMTGELADCFATKREGVIFVLDAFRSAFPEIEQHVFGVDGRFRSSAEAREEPHQIAAANWMASARLVSRTYSDVVLIDVGSTTTDITPVVDGRVAAVGRTDTERLAAGELVYTGVLRTPVCAIVRSVPLGGGPCPVAAEHFAVAADVHCWLGNIGESSYVCETPDGKGRSRPEAGTRLARMVCADAETLTDAEITTIAQSVARAQTSRIEDGIRKVRDRFGPAAPSTALLLGEGAFLARAAAAHIGLGVDELAERLGTAVSRCGPAAAVAYLLSEPSP